MITNILSLISLCSVVLSFNNTSNINYKLLDSSETIINEAIIDTILDRYTGTWKVINQSSQAAWTPESQSEIFEQVAGYRLQEKLLEISTKSKGIELYELMQLDPERYRYERWLFDSNGNGSNWIGNWDPKSNAMKWTLQTCGYLESEVEVEGVIVETFSSPEKYEKELIIKTVSGDILVNIKSVHEKVSASR